MAQRKKDPPDQSKGPLSRKDKNTLYCSFCGKSQHEVKKLIAGPTVFICDECTELCTDIVNEENRKADPSLVGSLLRYQINVRFDRPFEPRETALLPAIMKTIQDAYHGCSISMNRFELVKNGAVLGINFDSPVKIPAPEIAALEAEVENLSRLLKIEQEKYLAKKSEKDRFEDQYRDLVETTLPLMLENLRKQGRIAERNAKTMLILFC